MVCVVRCEYSSPSPSPCGYLFTVFALWVGDFAAEEVGKERGEAHERLLGRKDTPITSRGVAFLEDGVARQSGAGDRASTSGVGFHWR